MPFDCALALMLNVVGVAKLQIFSLPPKFITIFNAKRVRKKGRATREGTEKVPL